MTINSSTDVVARLSVLSFVVAAGSDFDIHFCFLLDYSFGFCATGMHCVEMFRQSSYHYIVLLTRSWLHGLLQLSQMYPLGTLLCLPYDWENISFCSP